MQKFRLRTAPRNDDWSLVHPPVHDITFDSVRLSDAIAMARNLQINIWETQTDIAWLTDEEGTIVWVLTRNEDR